MSTREEHYATLPDLGLHVDPEAAARERVQRAEETAAAALAVDAVLHQEYAAQLRRDAWTARLAWLLGFLCAWAALEADTNTPAYMTAATSLVAFVVFAFRSCARCEAMDRHLENCPAVPR